MTTENTPIPGALNNVIRIDDEQIKGHLDRIVRGTVEETLNALLESEADRLCNAHRYERTEARRDTRAGHYERNLQTKAGEVTLKVPKLRRQTFETAIIERYRRSEASVEEASKSPSNVLPMRPGYPSTGLPEGASLTAQGRIPEIDISSHVAAFVRQRLETSNGSSLAAGELRVAYEAWCATQGHKPLSLPKFAAELKALGYDKWKSCGVIRYRGVRFAA